MVQKDFQSRLDKRYTWKHISSIACAWQKTITGLKTKMPSQVNAQDVSRTFSRGPKTDLEYPVWMKPAKDIPKDRRNILQCLPREPDKSYGSEKFFLMNTDIAMLDGFQWPVKHCIVTGTILIAHFSYIKTENMSLEPGRSGFQF